MKQTIIFLILVFAAANGFPQERGRPQYPPGQTSGCPSGFGPVRDLEPDSDLLTWPIVCDIGKASLRSGFQTVTRARLCEKAGDWSRAGNYYVEAQSLLARAIPMDKQIELLARAARVRINAASAFYKAGNEALAEDALSQTIPPCTCLHNTIRTTPSGVSSCLLSPSYPGGGIIFRLYDRRSE